ncbi:hypothetical protein HMP0721_1529 [Pseudoramibacter alactolyticus ATCC 23263]|uniref:Uncharacterized protein n=1 Tax=Pseudoramibacter alactolyticus ATCC 23263 TaxID=887929 RepID=E6MHP4_9FIRM|nr:hypothetical protein HMP0721_1529 [Pseudoramibacter alactolyticus ATCC 23263]
MVLMIRWLLRRIIETFDLYIVQSNAAYKDGTNRHIGRRLGWNDSEREISKFLEKGKNYGILNF